MDRDTIDALAALGWTRQLGRDESGPYIAFVRGADCFHVTLDSRRAMTNTEREYTQGRSAMTVTATERLQ